MLYTEKKCEVSSTDKYVRCAISEVAAEIEKVFCLIQHQSGGKFHPPAHHIDFAPYGDDEKF